MKKNSFTFAVLCSYCLGTLSIFAEQPTPEKIELDAYWAEVSRAVGEGDFEAYKATCHEEGVLVAGINKKSYPLSEALAGWKKEFDDTRDGKRTSSVTFRFSERIINSTTAHETGIFLYTAIDADGKNIAEHIHLEALLIKKNDEWKILMEYQKSKATPQEWEALATDGDPKGLEK